MKELPAALEQARGRLPSMLIGSLREQVPRIDQLQSDIAQIERRLSQQLRQSAASKARQFGLC